MGAEPTRVSRRRRRTPRGVPAIVEEREQRPFIFGYGAGLSRREREQLKERIALISGIFIALVVGAIIAWGVIEDNVIKPAQQTAANNKPVASIGNYVITTGFFKALENFSNSQLQSNLSQVQSQLAAVGNNPKNAAQKTQLQQQQAQIESQISGLATNTLDEIINDQIALQRGYTVGFPPNKKNTQTAVTQFQHQVGGPDHYKNFIQQSGMTQPQFQSILVGEYLLAKIQQKITSKVPHLQSEVRASHILLAGTAKGHALAIKLMKEVQYGASFAQLAKQYSTDTGTKKKGGDLGFFSHGQMVAPFDKEAFKLKQGQMGIVKSQFGWHLILVTGHTTKRLTGTQYQQAQQTAYQNWLAAQKAVLREQNFVPTSQLPQVATTPTVSPLTAPQTQITAAPAVTARPATRATVVVPTARPAATAATGKKK